MAVTAGSTPAARENRAGPPPQCSRQPRACGVDREARPLDLDASVDDGDADARVLHRRDRAGGDPLADRGRRLLGESEQADGELLDLLCGLQRQERLRGACLHVEPHGFAVPARERAVERGDVRARAAIAAHLDQLAETDRRLRLAHLRDESAGAREVLREGVERRVRQQARLIA